jgi:hypothetical protein
VAQYQILFTYLGALIIKTNSLTNFSDFGLGSLLLFVNFIIIALALYMGAHHIIRVREARIFGFNSAEFDVIHDTMKKHVVNDEKAEAVIQQLTLDRRDVIPERKIGNGSFGAV